MEENALTKVARIVAGSVMGATYKDKDGKQQVIKPTGDANFLDLSGVITNSGSTGGTTGGATGGTTGGGTAPSQTPQLPSTENLFTGSAVGNILLSGPSANYDNVQDGLLITLSSVTSVTTGAFNVFGSDNNIRMDLSSIGLQGIKIPKEKLIVNGSFDISDQLSQYIGKTVNGRTQIHGIGTWNDMIKAYGSSISFSVLSFGGATINVLPNTTLSMNLTVNVQLKDSSNNTVHQSSFPIPVVQVNTYKN